MKTTALLLAICMAGCSCSWLQKKGPDGVIATVYDTAAAVTAAGEGAYRIVCGKVAEACFEAKDEECSSLKACQSDRDGFTTRMAAVNALLAIAKGQNLSGKIQDAKDIEAKAQKLLDEAITILKGMVNVK